MSLQAFSACPGMAWNPGSGWAGPVTTSGVTEEEPSGGRRLVGRARLRRRAHTKQGTFQPDDPATPDVNEAFEEEPEAQLKAEAQPGKLEQRDLADGLA